MNILFASTVYPSGGDVTRGTYNRELCAALADRADVRIVAPIAWTRSIARRDHSTTDDPAGVPIARPTFWYAPRVAQGWLGRRLFAAMRAGTRRIGRGWRPDLVLSYWLYPDGWAGQKLASDFGCKHATIVGGSDVLKLPSEPIRGPLVRSVLGQADLMLAVSRQLVDAVHAVDSAANAAVWSQGIRTSVLHDGPKNEARGKLGLEPDTPTFLWVGRMVPVKALPRLVEALALLRQRTPAKLVLVGGGPEREPIEQHITQAGLADVVRLVGTVEPSKLGDWYRAADAVVLSSDSEGLPNILREGLACGRPFAACDVGGISEIGDETCRVLAAPGDAAALADAMHTVLEPRYQTAAVGRPVRTWGDAADDLLAAVDAVDAKSPAAAGRSLLSP